MWVPYPEVGEPLLSLDHWQRRMQSEVVSVAVLKKVVEQHRIALDRPNLETLPAHPLGERRLSSRLLTLLIGEVKKKRNES